MEAKDIVLALKALNLTQVQISERTGIPQPTISKIERGAVSDVLSRKYRALRSLYDDVTAPKRTRKPAQTL